MSVKNMNDSGIYLGKGLQIFVLSPNKAIVVGEKNHFVISGEDRQYLN